MPGLASAGVRTCLHSRGSSDQPARDWVASDLSQVPHGTSLCGVERWRGGPASQGMWAAPHNEIGHVTAKDSEFNVRHLQRLLGKECHLVRLANNGREALALLRIGSHEAGVESPPAAEFDLLRLDLHIRNSTDSRL
jgi:hypothetical protein